MMEKFLRSGPEIAGSAWIHPAAVLIGRAKTKSRPLWTI